MEPDRGKEKVKRRVLLFLFLLMLIQSSIKLESFAQSVQTGEEAEQSAEEEEEGQKKFPSFSKENIVLSQEANEHGWINQDTVFTVSLPEGGDYAEGTLFVEYKKQEDAAWTAMSCDSEQPFQYAFMESDSFYDGAYQFRLCSDMGNSTPEEEWVTIPFRKDSLAPMLLSFAAEGNCVQFVPWEGGTIPLYKNKEGADITFELVIDDGEKEWQEQAVHIQIVDVAEDRIAAEFRGGDSALAWTHEGRLHRAVFGFDGEAGKESVYQIRFSYSDKADNYMCDGREESTETGKEFPAEVQEQGVCVSGLFVLDHAAPGLWVDCTEAVRMIKDGKDCTASEVSAADCTSYYNADIMVKFVIQDEHMKFADLEGENGEVPAPENFRLELVKREGGAEDAGSVEEVTAAVKWNGQGTEGMGYEGSFQISEEGDYRLRAFYADAAGNPVQVGEAGEPLIQGMPEAGCWESPLLVLDRTAPILSIHCTEIPRAEYCGRRYFNTDVMIQLAVEDKNFRVQELKKVLLGFEAVDGSGESLKEDTDLMRFLSSLEDTEVSRAVWTVELPFSTDANYSVPIALCDLAGNQAVWKEDSQEGGGVENPEGGEEEPAEKEPVEEESVEEEAVHMEYLTIDKDTPKESAFEYSKGQAVNYLPGGWLFSGEKTDIKITAEDGISGIREIHFEFTDLDGEKTIRTQKFQPSVQGAFIASLPLEDREDFKGTVTIRIYDWAGNCLEKSRGCAVESGKRHQSSGTARIDTLTEPSRTVDGVHYYNTDVTFRLTLADEFSGLGSFRYSGGNTLAGGRNYAEEAGEDLGTASEQEITYEFSRELTLEASANNENDILAEASYVDNAGYTGAVECRYHIDVATPEISVEYDLNEPAGGRYYHQPRTATVTIRERNFDERDVDFQITSTEGHMPEISGWTSTGSGDDTLHVCRLVFSEDGDYTFTLAFQDLAGNRAVYGKTDEFTIDRTAPELTVSWDNTDSRNGIYYADSRTAVITVQEHNFDEALLDIAVTAEKDPKAGRMEEAAAGEGEEKDIAAVPSVSAWSHSGDRHTARITFARDGIYTLAIEGEDLAGNRLTAYETEAFVIDCTPPEALIFDVTDRSANRGEVSPGIRLSDTNLDPDSVRILLAGSQKGEISWEGTQTPVQNGMEMKMKDFAYVPEMDDMYVLRAAVRDLAGNRSEAQVRFSVNRFGSVYSFDAKTEALVGKNGKYYTNQEQDLVITETNVDTLEFREIICNQDGKLRTLLEGADYTVKESGDSSGWKQYTYTIGRENFKEEGTYLLVIYSEDRAENVSDTGSKGKKIEFAVDKTKPDIRISGAENRGQYREGEREVTLDIYDNLRLQEVSVSLNGEETVYSASELEENGGRIVLQIKGQNYWQELAAEARDAAGNTVRTETLRLLVTPNLLVQLLMNKAACGAAAAVLLILIAGSVCLFRTRAEKEMEKDGEKRI